MLEKAGQETASSPAQPIPHSFHRPQPDGPAASHQHQGQVLEPVSQWYWPLQASKELRASGQPCGPLPWRARQSQEQPQPWSPWPDPPRGPPAWPEPCSAHSGPGPARYLPYLPPHLLSSASEAPWPGRRSAQAPEGLAQGCQSAAVRWALRSPSHQAGPYVARLIQCSHIPARKGSSPRFRWGNGARSCGRAAAELESHPTSA